MKPAQKASRYKKKKVKETPNNIKKPLVIPEKLTQQQEPEKQIIENKKHLSPHSSAFKTFVIAWIIIMIDQISKFLALIFLKPQDKISFLIFDLHYIKNTGAAFGTLENYTLFLSIVSLVFVVLVLGVIFISTLAPKSALVENIYKYTKYYQGSISLGFILGGAAGNLVDRAIRLYVIDFIDFRIWPVFNFADLFIVIGVIGLLLTIIQVDRKKINNYV